MTRGVRGGLWAAGIAALLAALPASSATAPPRIASLNLTSDEILVEIVDPAELVAVTAVSDEPDTSNVAGRMPKGAMRFRRADLERLLTLAPTLVIVSEYTDADFLRLLVRSGLRYHRIGGLQSLVGIRQAILDLGAAVGRPEGAAAVAARYDRRLQDLGARLAGAERPRVLYWSDPMTAGRGTVISDVIEAAGGRSVGVEMGIDGILPVGTERVFLANPDYVLIGSAPGTRKTLEEDPLLSKMKAVREGRVIEMPNRLLITLSQYAADAAWTLAARLHPDRVGAQ
jgi:iron complex transport system substrate-binding protein